MSDLSHHLRAEFQDPEYRYAYAESFLNTKVATQIKTLREQRGKTQAEVAALMGIKQPGYRRFEDVNHGVWKTDTLWSIARAFGVRLTISFETFGSLLQEKKQFHRELLKRPDFEHDPAFEDLRQEVQSAEDALNGDSGAAHASRQEISLGETTTALSRLTVERAVAGKNQLVATGPIQRKGQAWAASLTSPYLSNNLLQSALTYSKSQEGS